MTKSDAESQARFEQLGRFFMGTSDVHIAMARVVKTLEELGIPYAICGAMAVNAHGLKRATEDVDILLTPEGHAKFKAHALQHGFVEKFPGSRGVKEAETKVPIDFLLTGGIPGDGVPRGVVFPDPATVAIENAGAKYVDLGTLIEMKVASLMSRRDRLRDGDDVIRLIRANELATSATRCTRTCARSTESSGGTRNYHPRIRSDSGPRLRPQPPFSDR